jgi:4-hydroxy-3-methylbut-2-enyl diphosphate reductase IspH
MVQAEKHSALAWRRSAQKSDGFLSAAGTREELDAAAVAAGRYVIDATCSWIALATERRSSSETGHSVLLLGEAALSGAVSEAASAKTTGLVGWSAKPSVSLSAFPHALVFVLVRTPWNIA